MLVKWTLLFGWSELVYIRTYNVLVIFNAYIFTIYMYVHTGMKHSVCMYIILYVIKAVVDISTMYMCVPMQIRNSA